MIINDKPRDIIKPLINRWSNYVNIDINKAYQYCISKEYPILPYLEDKWYKNYDYSVYNDNYYISDLIFCWLQYSRKYLREIYKKINFKDIKVVVDLGCGIGITTRALKEMFPEAIVYGTNLKDTIQYEFATDYGKEYNFKIIPNLKEIKNIDLVFASEYFEHILNPIDHLIEVLYYSNTKNLIIANSFNTKSIGHFNEYQVADKTVPASKLSRIFNSELRNQGWNQIKTEIWNNKPAYWTDEI